MIRVGVFLTLVLTRVFCSPAILDFWQNAVRSNVNQRVDVESLAMEHSYYMETHKVTTSDGYLLSVHRLPSPRGVFEVEQEEKPVVLVLHGLSSASHNFLALGPEYAVGYNLADAGFDVWLANARGNIHARAHVDLNPDDEIEKISFFDFSWEEIGMYDLADTVDYILEHTGKSKLHYIGHSQGGTAFLVLNSMRPDYNDKFVGAHLFAGVGYMEYFPDEELKAMAANVDLLYAIAVAMGYVEISNVSNGLQRIKETPIYSLADILLKFDFFSLTKNTDLDAIIAALGNGGSGASLKQNAHYGQNIQSGIFRRWDYGSATNLQVYNTTEPPSYDLSLITVNTTMHYTISDYLLDERDVIAMASDMPNCIVRKVARDSFGHSDFVAASDVKELVTDYVIDEIRHAASLVLLETDIEEMEQTASLQSSNSADQFLLSRERTLKLIILTLSCIFLR